MPRQIVVFALAVILVACAKEAEKPVDKNEEITAVGERPVEYQEQRLTGVKDSLARELMKVVYQYPEVGNHADNGSEGEKITWSPDNIHLVRRANDTLVLATFQRHQGENYCHAASGLMDLVAASLKRGMYRIIDTLNSVELGSWGYPPPMQDYPFAHDARPRDECQITGSGFVRLGRDTWGWITNSPWSGGGWYENYVTVFGLIDSQIVNLGGFYAETDNTGAYDSVYHTYTSAIKVVDRRHSSLSDIAIVWRHNFSGVDSSRKVTVHRYIPGKGYDFSKLPYENCTHATNYCMKRLHD